MNLLFFLTPKSELVVVREDNTLDKVLSTMEKSRYTGIPVIDKRGHYIGTLTEGDILWAMKNSPEISFETASTTRLNKIARLKTNRPVNVNATLDELLELALTQNFIPVIDDDEIFIGIVTRRDILTYYHAEKQQQRIAAQNSRCG
jgi:CBS domain-containing protein